MAYRKPAFIFPIVGDHDVEYLASSGNEPDAATPAWTLDGVDHASIVSDVLQIECTTGTDQCSYYKSIAPTSGDPIWVKMKCKFATDSTRQGLQIWAAGIDCKLELVLRGDFTGTMQVIGASTKNVACDLTTDYVTILVLLTEGGYRIWLGDANGDNMTLLDSGLPASYSGSTDRIYFGKISAMSDIKIGYWDYVKYSIGESYLFDLPAQDWDFDDVKPQRTVKKGGDGSPETILWNNDLFGSFVSRVLNDTAKATLKGHYNTYMSPGHTFFVVKDQDDHTVAFHEVVCDMSRYKARRDPNVPTHWAINWRFMVVNE